MNEIRGFVSTQPKSELTDWLVWQESWPHWKELLEVNQLLSPLSRTVDGPIPEVKYVRTETMTDSVIVAADRSTRERDFKDITASDFTYNSDLDVEILGSHTKKQSLLKNFIKRNFTRYKKQLKIHITGADGQTFVSFSKDISVGGILLSDPLPHWVVGYNQVKIVDQSRKQAIEVTCSVVDEQDPNYRVRLEILPLQKKEEELHFDKWLAA